MEHVAVRTEALCPIVVRMAEAKVRLGAVHVQLRDREREIVVALAMQNRPMKGEALGQLLNADWDPRTASNNIKVYIYRLRRLVTRDFIVWRDGGYVFGPSVRVDVADAKRALDQLSRLHRDIAPAERERIIELARALRADPPAALLQLEWFEPFAMYSRRLGRDLAIFLGRDALNRGDHHGALRLGRELTYEDPCDEEAWELLIRAHLQRGEHPAAVQGFRFYEKTLAAQLQAAPSAHMRRLLGDGRVYEGLTAVAL
jgi:DNA-binding SARP family transcriptional activator